MKTYLRISNLNVLDVKELTALEYLDFEGKYKGYSESHDFCELCFVEEGEVEITLEEGELHLKGGELAFIAPDVRHSYFSRLGNKSRAFVVCFACPSPTVRLISGMRFELDEGLSFCMNRIIEESRGSFRMNDKELLELLPTAAFGGQQSIIILTEYLLIGLLRRLFESRGGEIVLLDKEEFYSDLGKLIIGYLKSNVRNRLTLNDVCKHFNYSRSFICRVFKEQTGHSMITYFNRLKIDEAKKLLTESEQSVAEISELLGFSEPKYFGMLFKKQVGKTPVEYREGGLSYDTDSPWRN